jgi:hypothetical protein
MRGDPRAVLDSNVDIPEISLQWVPAVDRVCPSCVEHQIDRADRLDRHVAKLIVDAPLLSLF